MEGEDGQKAGMLSVVRGGKYPFRGRRHGPRARTKEEMELDRRMHTAVARIADPLGNVPDKRTYRMREGHGWPWRVLARAIVAWYRLRVPRHQVKNVIRTLDDWTDEVYDGRFNRDGRAA